MKKYYKLLCATIVISALLLVAGVAYLGINVPVEVKEPLIVVAYPEALSLYPNMTEAFNITVQNAASVNYLVQLAFSLNDTVYQQAYVTFSNVMYTVLPGLNVLTASMTVAANAPPASLDLEVELSRVLETSSLEGIHLSSFHFEWLIPPVKYFENFTHTQVVDISFHLVPTLAGANLSITAEFATTPPLIWHSLLFLFDYDGDDTLCEEHDYVFLLSENNKTSYAEIINGCIAFLQIIPWDSPFHVCYKEGNYLTYKINLHLSDTANLQWGTIALKNDLIQFFSVCGPIQNSTGVLHFDPKGILK